MVIISLIFKNNPCKKNVDGQFAVLRDHLKAFMIGTYIFKTSQELRMLSSVTLNCQTTEIVMNSGSQLSEL